MNLKENVGTEKEATYKTKQLHIRKALPLAGLFSLFNNAKFIKGHLSARTTTNAYNLTSLNFAFIILLQNSKTLLHEKIIRF